MKQHPIRQTARRLAVLFAAVALAAVAGCHRAGSDDSVIKSEGTRVGYFKGYVAINQALRERLMDPAKAATASYSYGRYFGHYDDAVDGLAVLLGSFSGQGASNKFINGAANAMNMILWKIGMRGVARDLAVRCDATQSAWPDTYFPLNASFGAVLKDVCTWPADGAKARLGDFWTVVMGYEAPDAEQAAWTQLFAAPDSPYAQATPAVAVEAMSRTILLNPYFLLEQ